MKNYFLYGTALLLLSLTLLALFPGKLPPVPEITKELYGPVNLHFRIHKMDLNQCELAHANPGEPLFVNFEISGSWSTRRPTLLISSASEQSRLPNGMDPKEFKGKKDGKDFSQFMKDNRGRPVQSYNFVNTITEDKDGKRYLKMTLKGPDMPMVGTMIVRNKVTFPAFLSRKFQIRENISLAPGEYALDPSINGFWIQLAEP